MRQRGSKGTEINETDKENKQVETLRSIRYRSDGRVT